MKLRLQPIRVFCFHQVSDVFDASTMWECDWTQTDIFMQKILSCKEKYEFISLEEAYWHIQNDAFRKKKYAALTADDGWASLKNIIPWLVEQQIPITLFVNSAYLDGKHYQERETEKLLTKEDLIVIANKYPQYVTIASHGETHINTLQMTDQEFEISVINAESILNKLPNKIGFYAFTYGKYKDGYLPILQKYKLVPVLVNGCENYRGNEIHRECIDGVKS